MALCTVLGQQLIPTVPIHSPLGKHACGILECLPVHQKGPRSCFFCSVIQATITLSHVCNAASFLNPMHIIQLAEMDGGTQT